MGARGADLFLVGMLSTLDTLLGQPMDVALDQLGEVPGIGPKRLAALKAKLQP